jgi:hypothetical protein
MLSLVLRSIIETVLSIAIGPKVSVRVVTRVRIAVKVRVALG